MRRLHPPDGEEPADLVAAYAYPDLPNRPWVRANMVSSLDGAASVNGRSAGLSTPADKRLFALLRALADVVLVGAGTARTEGYGPGRVRPEHASLREKAGQPSLVSIALISQSLNLDLSSALFTPRPIIITCSRADPHRLDSVSRAADLVMAGEEQVDLGLAMTALQQRGLRRVLCEGGPRLLGDLVRSGLLDELCLTLSPLLVGGDASRILAGDNVMAQMTLGHVLEEDGTLFARYVRT